MLQVESVERVHVAKEGGSEVKREGGEVGTQPSRSATTSRLSPVLELEEGAMHRLEAKKRHLYAMIEQKADRSKIELAISALQSEFPPCPHLFNVILRARIMTNHTNGIRGVMEEFAQHGLKPNRFTYSLLINYYRLQKRMDCAELLLERMLEKQLPVDPSHFTTMVIGWARQGNLSRAQHWFDRLRRTDSTQATEGTLQSGFGEYVDQVAVHALAHGYLLHQQPAKARNLLQQAKEAGMTPTRVTAKLEMHLRLQEGYPAEAMHLYRRLFVPAVGTIPPAEWLEVARWFLQAEQTAMAQEICLDAVRLVRAWQSDLLLAIIDTQTDLSAFEAAMREAAGSEWDAMAPLFAQRWLALERLDQAQACLQTMSNPALQKTAMANLRRTQRKKDPKEEENTNLE